MAIVSEDLILIKSLSHIVGDATGAIHLPILSVLLGTKCYLQIDDLTVPEISDKFSRLTKYVGY